MAFAIASTLTGFVVGAVPYSHPRIHTRRSVSAVLVSGSKLVDAGGQDVRLIGLNRSGTEYACAQGWGIFDGPSSPNVVRSMKSWHINAVRVPLNEDCWLGINVPLAYSGAVYRQAIRRYVSELSSQGIVSILDLHWSAPGSDPAESQQPMPDAHSVPFWGSIAHSFRHNAGVIFAALQRTPWCDVAVLGIGL